MQSQQPFKELWFVMYIPSRWLQNYRYVLPVPLQLTYDFAGMDIDRAAEWRRLKEVYAAMSDEELSIIADEAFQLTDVAKQAFAAEISARRLDVQLRTEPPEEEVGQESGGKESSVRGWEVEDEGAEENRPFDPDELELEVVHRCWDFKTASIAKKILDNAGIPSYLGDENIEKIDDYKGSFEGGVDLKVRAVDRSWASSAFAKQWPEPTPEEQHVEKELDGEYAVFCPRCRSTEVVFQGRECELEGNEAFHAKFVWTCDACGNEWVDDGIEQRV